MRRLEADVFPVIGSLPIAKIPAHRLVAMAKKIEARGALGGRDRGRDHPLDRSSGRRADVEPRAGWSTWTSRAMRDAR